MLLELPVKVRDLYHFVRSMQSTNLFGSHFLLAVVLTKVNKVYMAKIKFNKLVIITNGINISFL